MEIFPRIVPIFGIQLNTLRASRRLRGERRIPRIVEIDTPRNSSILRTVSIPNALFKASPLPPPHRRAMKAFAKFRKLNLGRPTGLTRMTVGKQRDEKEVVSGHELNQIIDSTVTLLRSFYAKTNSPFIARVNSSLWTRSMYS